MDTAAQQQIGDQIAQAVLYGMVFAVIVGLSTRQFVDLLAGAYWSWRSWRRLCARRRRTTARVSS